MSKLKSKKRLRHIAKSPKKFYQYLLTQNQHIYLAANCGGFYTEASTCLKGRSMSQAIKEDLIDDLDEDEQDKSLWEEADLNPDPCWY